LHHLTVDSYIIPRASIYTVDVHDLTTVTLLESRRNIHDALLTHSAEQCKQSVGRVYWTAERRCFSIRRMRVGDAYKAPGLINDTRALYTHQRIPVAEQRV